MVYVSVTVSVFIKSINHDISCALTVAEPLEATKVFGTNVKPLAIISLAIG